MRNLSATIASIGMVQAPVTVEHFRQHVLEDAADLISAIGIMDPLIYEDLNELRGEKQHVGRFLRKLLARNVVLIVARLHERSRSGPAGETASIDGLLDRAQGQLPPEKIARFRERRRGLIANLEASGIPYSDLYEFRTTEMAHSIHRVHRNSGSNLFYHPISEFAHDHLRAGFGN